MMCKTGWIIKESSKTAGKEILKEVANGILPPISNERKGKWAGDDKIPVDIKVPSNLKHGGVLAGYYSENIFGKKLIKFPSNDWRSKIVVGPAGSGKSTFGINYLLNCDHGCAFFDNKDGKAIDDILYCLPEDRLKKTVVLDHSNKHYPIPVGNFESSGDVFGDDEVVCQWLDFFISNFDVGDQHQTKELIVYSVKAAFGIDGATLLDVVNFVTDESYRAYILNKLPRQRYREVIEWWNRFAEKSKGQRQQIAAPFERRLGILTWNRFLRYTLGSKPRGKLNYRKWIDEGYTVLIKAPEAAIGSEAARMIISLHVMSFWRSTLSRGANGGQQFTIICDEPQTWLSKNADRLDNIFSKARSFNLNLAMLFQSTEQIKKESPALLNIILHNEPDVIAFAPIGVSGFKRSYFDNLKKFSFVGRIDGVGPIRVSSPDYPARQRDNINNIYKSNRERFNRHWQAIESEIKGRSKWENANTKESRKESRENISDQKLYPGSPTGTERSSNSFKIIE